MALDSVLTLCLPVEKNEHFTNTMRFLPSGEHGRGGTTQTASVPRGRGRRRGRSRGRSRSRGRTRSEEPASTAPRTSGQGDSGGRGHRQRSATFHDSDDGAGDSNGEEGTDDGEGGDSTDAAPQRHRGRPPRRDITKLSSLSVGDEFNQRTALARK